jgi:hypothetical protein
MISNPENKTDPELNEPEDTDAGDSPQTASVRRVTAAGLVSDDTDRPKADAEPIRIQDRPDDPVGGPSPSEMPKTRRKMAPEERQRRKIERAKALLEGKPPPSFSDLGGGKVQGIPTPQPKRDYTQEALAIFVPTSLAAAKFWGNHWGVDFDPVSKAIKLTNEQIAYVQSLAEEIEYEGWGQMNPRYKFLFHSVMYCGPRFRTEPTPARIAAMWHKVSDFFRKIMGFKPKYSDKIKREQKQAEKEAERQAEESKQAETARNSMPEMPEMGGHI